jgi:hypothetical protein
MSRAFKRESPTNVDLILVVKTALSKDSPVLSRFVFSVQEGKAVSSKRLKKRFLKIFLVFIIESSQ